MAASLKKFLFALVIFLGFVFIYTRFASNDYLAVDGSLRNAEVFYTGRPFLHGNNHMLYPVHVYYFDRALGRIGIKPQDLFAFIRRVSALNAASGAAALAILFLILAGLTENYYFSAWGVCVLGFSHAYLVNATNSNEPMPAFLLSMVSLGLSLLAVARQRLWYCVLAGFFISYAMATYQSMFSIFPAQVLLFLYGFTGRDKGRALSVRFTLSFIAAVLAGIGLLYGVCYSHFLKINTLRGFLGRFFTIDGSGGGLWGGWKFSSFIGLFFGLVRAFFYLPFCGMRETFLVGGFSFGSGLMWLAAAILMAGLFILLFRSCRQMRLDALRLPLVFLGFTLILPFYWNYIYTKLWLQPLCILVIIMVIVFSRQRKARVNGFLAAFVLILLAWNGATIIIPDTKCKDSCRYLGIAGYFDRFIGSDSLVLCEWDPVGVLFPAFFKREREFLDVPALGCALRQSKSVDKISQVIDKKIAQARQEGRKVYSIGVLNIDKKTWDKFLGGKVGIDYGLFQKYRENCREVVVAGKNKEKYSLFELY